MKKELVLAVALALGSTLAVAAGDKECWDKNAKDGSLSKEAAALCNVKDFDKADANKDGKLSNAEYTQATAGGGAAGPKGDAPPAPK